jgi:hypothetical protein
VGIYSSLMLVVILLTWLNPAKDGATVEARTSRPDLIQQANMKR